MNNSILFKKAHIMTKAVIKSGDNYQVTFGQCLKAVKAKAEKQAVKPLDSGVVSSVLAQVLIVMLVVFMCLLLAGIGLVALESGLVTGAALISLSGYISLFVVYKGVVNSVECIKLA